MANPTPLPKYIYKILPSTSPPPSPLPIALPVSDLDKRDNFIHLSTSSQILRTLRNFFDKEEQVHVLRIPYDRVSKWVLWEDTKGKQPGKEAGEWDVDSRREYFPHVHGNGLKIGREEVNEVGLWKRGAYGWSVVDWPFGEDRARE